MTRGHWRLRTGHASSLFRCPTTLPVQTCPFGIPLRSKENPRKFFSKHVIGHRPLAVRTQAHSGTQCGSKNATTTANIDRSRDCLHDLEPAGAVDLLPRDAAGPHAHRLSLDGSRPLVAPVCALRVRARGTRDGNLPSPHRHSSAHTPSTKCGELTHTACHVSPEEHSNDNRLALLQDPARVQLAADLAAFGEYLTPASAARRRALAVMGCMPKFRMGLWLSGEVAYMG